MTPQDFISKWGIDREQLRGILRAGRSTIDHWLTDRDAPPTTQAHLDLADSVLEQIAQIHRKHPHLFEVYIQSRDMLEYQDPGEPESG
ncbi:MAG TPA: hypothetical protein V6C57_19675 [Coleofasciculaceae cyanobacterium]